MHYVSSIVVSLGVLFSVTAHAGPPGLTTIDAPPRSIDHDYPGTMIAADAVAVALTGLALHNDDPYVLLDGFALGLASGPTAHLFERRQAGDA